MIIRRQPEDFVVVERLTPEWLARVSARPLSGEACAVWRLTKTSLTTPEATARLARALGVSAGAVAHAGLKDKHGVTTQFVTAPARDASGDAAALSGPGFTAERVGWSRDMIDAKAIEANAFAILVRGLTRESSRETARRAEALRDPAGYSAGAAGASEAARLLVVNYFGDQRFGSARHGEGFAGRHLVRGEFEAALRLLIATPARKDSGARRTFTRLAVAGWEGREWKGLVAKLPACPERRAVEALAAGGAMKDAFAALPNMLQQMAVDAYQSWLWNKSAVRMAREIAGMEPTGSTDFAEPKSVARVARGTGDRAILADDPFGAMVFPAWSMLAPSAVESWREVTIPMPESEMDSAGPGAAAMMSVLKDEGLSPADMRVPGLRRPTFGGAARRLLVEAREFALEAARADEFSASGRGARLVRFVLPRGAYATVVLRALGG